MNLKEKEFINQLKDLDQKQKDEINGLKSRLEQELSKNIREELECEYQIKIEDINKSFNKQIDVIKAKEQEDQSLLNNQILS